MSEFLKTVAENGSTLSFSVLMRGAAKAQSGGVNAYVGKHHQR